MVLFLKSEYEKKEDKQVASGRLEEYYLGDENDFCVERGFYLFIFSFRVTVELRTRTLNIIKSFESAFKKKKKLVRIISGIMTAAILHTLLCVA